MSADPEPTAMILRFSGDPDLLVKQFEEARHRWIADLDEALRPPTFHAACKTRVGIAVVMAWPSNDAHKAFGPGMREHLQAVGMRRPDAHERLRIAKLGWD